jgi:colanic acid/amylovoran biosynthesis glycosyltransferase
MATGSQFLVLHVKQPRLEATETFVTARLLNPACKRPVPLLTHEAIGNNMLNGEVCYHPLHSLNRFRRRLDLAVGYRFGFYPYYFQTIRRIKPDVIHAHFSGAGMSVLWPALRLGVPLVINFYGIETKYQIHEKAWQPFYHRLARSKALFVCSSDAMKRDMVAFGFRPERIEVVRCGIDTQLFDGPLKEYRAGEPFRILTVARLHVEKGLQYLLEACQLLVQSHFPSWRLRIVGNGPLREDLMMRCRSLGIEKFVTFVGEKTSAEVVEEMQAAHLFILPSLKETQGVVLQEAQATRTPVIATNVGGIPEGVVDNVTGFLVEPCSPRKIRDKIHLFVQRPGLLKAMGEEGRKFVVAKFNRSDEYALLAQVYERAILERGKP